MKFSSLLTALVATAAAAPLSPAKRSTQKNILLTNDDGWAATNIRATYRELKAAGYNVVLVAPASQRLGFGGQFQIPTSPNLTADGEFGYVKKGDPSWGHEADDDDVWYFDGTPAACVAFGADYVFPKFKGNVLIDLVVSGPNEGTNLSPGYFTLSGTIGAAYNAVYRGLPSIAFSGSNSANAFFKNDTSRSDDASFPPNIYAHKVVDFVNQLFARAGDNGVLPISTGVNVNFPLVGDESTNCTDPQWVFTRLSGAASTGPSIQFNASTGLFDWEDKVSTPLLVCVEGDCSLPSEAFTLYKESCKTSVSVFSVDYDATKQQEQVVKTFLNPLFK